MGYLIKTNVIDALKEDRETSIMCYNDQPTRDIVNFCYDSMEREIDKLQQYQVDNVTEFNAGEIMNFAVAVLAGVAECARQEDTPIYQGDKEVDCFVKMSDVNEVINKCLFDMNIKAKDDLRPINASGPKNIRRR